MQDIKKQLEMKKAALEKIYDQQYTLEKEIKGIEVQLDLEIRKKVERERKVAADTYLSKQFGIQSEETARDSIYIVFNIDAIFMKTVTCKNNSVADFYYISGEMDSCLETWLIQNKLYAHCASSFCSRHKEWYQKTFRYQLENLGWEFDKNGRLKGVKW